MSEFFQRSWKVDNHFLNNMALIKSHQEYLGIAFDWERINYFDVWNLGKTNKPYLSTLYFQRVFQGKFYINLFFSGKKVCRFVLLEYSILTTKDVKLQRKKILIKSKIANSSEKLLLLCTVYTLVIVLILMQNVI